MTTTYTSQDRIAYVRETEYSLAVQSVDDTIAIIIAPIVTSQST